MKRILPLLLLSTQAFSYYDDSRLNSETSKINSAISQTNSEISRVEREISEMQSTLNTIDSKTSQAEQSVSHYRFKESSYRQDESTFAFQKSMHETRKTQLKKEIAELLKDNHELQKKLDVLNADISSFNELKEEVAEIKELYNWLSENHESLSEYSNEANKYHQKWINDFKKQVKKSAPAFREISSASAYKRAVRKVEAFKNKIPSTKRVEREESRLVAHADSSIKHLYDYQIKIRELVSSKGFAAAKFHSEQSLLERQEKFEEVDSYISDYIASLYRIRSVIDHKVSKRKYFVAKIYYSWLKMLKGSIAANNVANGAELINMINRITNSIEVIYGTVRAKLKNYSSAFAYYYEDLAPLHARPIAYEGLNYAKVVERNLDNLPLIAPVREILDATLKDSIRGLGIRVKHAEREINEDMAKLLNMRIRRVRKAVEGHPDRKRSPHCFDKEKFILNTSESEVIDIPTMMKHEKAYLEWRKEC